MSNPHSAEFKKNAKRAIILLTLINGLNYVDRYVVSALVESLKKSPLALTDTQAGLLMTSFLIVYMCASPIFGYLGDQYNRVKLMAIGVFIWSVATMLGGFAWSFAALFGFRALIGVGEASYGTIAPALITDYFAPEKRGKIFSIFYATIPIGAALGYIIGGFMDTHFGWRSAFFVAGAPGLILGLVLLKLVDPPRGIYDGAQNIGVQALPKTSLNLRDIIKSNVLLLRNITFLNTTLGYAAYTFSLGALAFWIPSFLEREMGMSKSQATFQFGLVVVATGFLGTIVGGWLADWLHGKVRSPYLWISGVSALLATPVVTLCFLTHDEFIFWISMTVAEILLFISTGPINLALVKAVDVESRARAMALSILVIHLIGDVPSPPLVGYLSDSFGLSKAMLIIPIFIFVSGLIWLYEARRVVT